MPKKGQHKLVNLSVTGSVIQGEILPPIEVDCSSWPKKLRSKGKWTRVRLVLSSQEPTAAKSGRRKPSRGKGDAK